MARKIRPEDLSERELRRLLIEKKRQSRQKRLEAFRRSGRILDVAPLPDDKTSSLFEDFVGEDNTYQPTERYRLADGSLPSWKEEGGLITADVHTTIKVDQDTWVVVMVHGSKDTAGFRSLFPVITNVLTDSKKYPETFDPLDLTTFHEDPNVWAPAWALANPIFIDADSDGVFTARYVREGLSPLTP